MKKGKKYPNVYRDFSKALIVQCFKSAGLVGCSDNETLQEDVTAQLFCFVAQRTLKLRKKLGALQTAQLPFPEQRPAAPTATPAPDRKADRHGGRLSTLPKP